MLYFRAYASKLMWARRTFSDCLAVLFAFTDWQTKKFNGYFQRSTGRGRTLEHEYCYNRYLQLKVFVIVIYDVEL